jgi:hypothetical protein
MIKLVKLLFNKYNIDFYINGHDHDFEHAHEKGKYTDYITTGTGGAIRSAGHNERTVFSISVLGFTYISLSPDELNLYFITSDGHVGYSFEKKKII